jgi:hypothetical protein
MEELRRKLWSTTHPGSTPLSLTPMRSGSSFISALVMIASNALSDKPQYEALSYMWGPKDYKSIEIDGVACNVRENLYRALLHLRLIDDNDGVYNNI